MKRILAASVLVLLSACERRQNAGEMADAPTDAAIDRGGPAPFYIGRWAASPDLCADGAWVIDASGVHTAGEVSCRFHDVPQGPGPVEVDATCHAEGEAAEWRLHISYAESAGALLIENGPFAAIGLQRCPEDARP